MRPIHLSFPRAILAVGAVATLVCAQIQSSCTVTNKPRSPDLACGKQGTFNQETAVYLMGDAQQFSSLEGCASMCGGRRYDPSIGQGDPDAYFPGYYGYDGYGSSATFGFCGGLQYNPQTGLCQLYAHQLNASFVTATAKSPYLFYDFSCFDCGPACPQKQGVNLFDNGGFEQKLLGPWDPSNGTVLAGTSSIDHSNVFQCNAQAFLSKPTSVHGLGCDIRQYLNTCSNAVYAIKFNYKMPSITGVEKDIVARFNDAKEDGAGDDQDQTTLTYSITQDSKIKDSTWKTAYGYALGPDPSIGFASLHGPTSFTFGSNVASYKGSSGEAKYNIDNVRVSRMPRNPPLKPGARSVIVNGGFESGKLAPWTITKSRRRITVVSPGLRNSQFAANIPPTLGGTLQQNLATTPGTLYKFSMDYTITSDFFVDMHVNFFGASGTGATTQVGNHYRLQILDSSNFGTLTFSIPYRATAANTTLQVFLIDATTHSHLVDNFRLIEIDESG